MERSTSRFLLGLGVGSLVGAMIYRCSQTAAAREWKKKMCCAAHQAAEKAGEWMTNAKEAAEAMVQKAAEDKAKSGDTVR